MGVNCCSNRTKILQPMTEEISTLNNKYNDIKINYRIYYDDIELQEKYISNYKTYVTELNYQLSDLKDKLNIVYSNPADINQNFNYTAENTNLLNNLDEINNKINTFHSLLEKQKTELKNLENDYRILQERYNEIKDILKKDKINKSELILNKIKSITQLEEIDVIKTNLKDNKIEYTNIKKEIEDYLKKLQKITKEKFEDLKNKMKNIKSNGYAYKNDSLFLKSSMLLEIEDFQTFKDKLRTIIIFKENEKNENISEEPRFLMKNWYEICYIYDDYDVHDINYELKIVGLLKYAKIKSSSFYFLPLYLESNSDNYYYHPDLIYHIETFEINGKESKYKYSNNIIDFKIVLGNLESAKIHIKYKEFIKYQKITEEEKIFSKINRFKPYGLSERLVGENAKYILKNESDLEIINFDDEFFLKTNDNEYQWGGKVPEGGKKTMIRMSKKEGIINFEHIYRVNTLDESNIKQIIIEIPFLCIGGNNYLNHWNYFSDQTEEINIDNQKKVYNVKFININTNSAEFHVELELKNFCKDGWNIDLTNEEIDSLIPPDYKINKVQYKEIANNIIKEYDEKNKDKKDLIKVKDIVKIGKWIKDNIKYIMGENLTDEITAIETYMKREGVCAHKTKLFNALIYSLGYQVIYVNGYAIRQKNTFDEKDNHAWSLIKMDGKWLPFDATMGIFSGKLPITHVYQKIGNNGAYIIEELSDEKAQISSYSFKGRIN